MKIAYLYNEKIPKKTAHDVYVWKNCYFLSQFLDESSTLSCLTGKSSLESMQALQKYYLNQDLGESENFKEVLSRKNVPFWSRFGDFLKSQSHQIGSFEWVELPLMRKSGPFRISWNTPFFYRCQKWIEDKKPDWVFMSVYKQAGFHLKRRASGVRYLFEVHDLAQYQDNTTPSERVKNQIEILSACDAITVTTTALKQALESKPYEIKTPIYVVPLGSAMNPFSRKSHPNELTLGYIGQLYPDQGVDSLVKALSQVSDIRLEIIGGGKKDLQRIKSLVYELKLENRVHFHGFVSPFAIESKIENFDAFAAPFYPTPHMKCVAHTKLSDYGRWALPVIAPDLPITREESRSAHFFFNPCDYPRSLHSLVLALEKFKHSQEREQAHKEIENDLKTNPDRFSWRERSLKLRHILYKSNEIST